MEVKRDGWGGRGGIWMEPRSARSDLVPRYDDDEGGRSQRRNVKRRRMDEWMKAVNASPSLRSKVSQSGGWNLERRIEGGGDMRMPRTRKSVINPGHRREESSLLPSPPQINQTSLHTPPSLHPSIPIHFYLAGLPLPHSQGLSMMVVGVLRSLKSWAIIGRRIREE